MAAGDLPDDRQAEPIAAEFAVTAGLEPHEGFKNPLPFLLRNAGAIVCHRQLDLGVGDGKGQGDRCPGESIGILEEIMERTFQQSGVVADLAGGRHQASATKR